MSKHKFTVEIKLENDKSCIGCQLVHYCDTFLCGLFDKEVWNHERLQECIVKFGIASKEVEILLPPEYWIALEKVFPY